MELWWGLKSPNQGLVLQKFSEKSLTLRLTHNLFATVSWVIWASLYLHSSTHYQVITKSLYPCDRTWGSKLHGPPFYYLVSWINWIMCTYLYKFNFKYHAHCCVKNSSMQWVAFWKVFNDELATSSNYSPSSCFSKFRINYQTLLINVEINTKYIGEHVLQSFSCCLEILSFSMLKYESWSRNFSFVMTKLKHFQFSCSK